MKKLITSLFMVSVGSAAGQVVGFGDGYGSSTGTIPNSSVTFQTVDFIGGVASPGPFHGALSTSIGGTFTGQVFDPVVDGTPSAATRISSFDASTLSMDPGATGTATSAMYENFLGLHVQFSAPIDLGAFAMLDVDGLITGVGTGNGEWSASYAYNSATGTSVLPTITLDGATQLSMETISTAGLNFGADAPANLDIAWRSDSSTGANSSPDDFENQVGYDFGGQFVTDFYFTWGVRGPLAQADVIQNSGVTGFTIPSSAVVPEPTGAFLLLTSAGLLLGRRRR